MVASTSIFYFLVDTVTANAYILYKETDGTHGKLTSKEFVLQLSERLITFHSSRKRAPNSNGPPASRLCQRHFPDELGKFKE
jgi:hypothetical protein